MAFSCSAIVIWIVNVSGRDVAVRVDLLQVRKGSFLRQSPFALTALIIGPDWAGEERTDERRDG
jgi:hypothetical protein